MPRDSVNKKVPIVPGHTTLHSLTHQVKGLKGEVLRYRSKSPKGNREMTPQRVGLKDWIQRCRAKHLVKQGREYRNLERDIDDLVPAEYANDPAVAKAHQKVKSLLQDAASGSWLHRDELAEKLDALNQAVVALEQRKANALQCVAQDNLNQVVQSTEAASPATAQQLAQTIFQPPGDPGEPAAFKYKLFADTANDNSPANGEYANADQKQAAEEREANRQRLDKARRKVDRNDRATMDLMNAFSRVGRSIGSLTDYQERCKRALTEKQLDPQDLHALIALTELGATPDLKGKLGSSYCPNTKAVNPPLSNGFAALQSLCSGVAQALLRMTMTLDVMAVHANGYANACANPDSQNPPEKHLEAFQGACREAAQCYRSRLEELLLVAHHLVNASHNFPMASTELKGLLQTHGECLLEVVAALSDPAQAASLPYVPMYRLAQWGTQDPKAAMAALVEANRLATPPAKPADPVAPPLLPVQDLVVPNPDHLQPELVDNELDRLMAEFDQVRDHEEGRDHLPGLLEELARLDEKAELPQNAPVPEKKDISDPGDPLAHEPVAPPPAEQAAVPTPRAQAMQVIQDTTAHLRSQADSLTKTPNQPDAGGIDLPPTLRIFSALGVVPVPKDWRLQGPKTQLPHDIRRGVAIAYNLTEAPQQLAQLDARARELQQELDKAQAGALDEAGAAKLAATVEAYKNAFTVTQRWLDSRSQLLRSLEFQEALDERDCPAFTQYGEALAAMANELRDPQSAEMKLYAAARDHARKRAKNQRTREKSTPNARQKVTRQTSAELKQRLRKELRPQTWSVSPSHEPDVELNELLNSMDTVAQMSPRTRTSSASSLPPNAQYIATTATERLPTGPAQPLPTVAIPPQAPQEFATTFDEVDHFLGKLQETATTLYKNETPQPLPMPHVAELPAHTQQVFDRNTDGKRLTKNLEALNQAKAQKDAAAIASASASARKTPGNTTGNTAGQQPVKSTGKGIARFVNQLFGKASA